MNAALETLQTLLIEDVLGREAAARHTEGKLGKRFLQPVAEALVNLSVGFTKDRARLADAYRVAAGHAAYTLYYLPVNFAKAWTLLNELASHPKISSSLIPHPSSFKIVDIGCGPGTASLATLFFLARRAGDSPPRVEFHLVDSSPPMLKTAERLLAKAAALLNKDRTVVLSTVRPHFHDLSRTGWPSAEGATIVWAGNVFNETPSDSARLVEGVSRTLAEDGSLIVFEPALRQTSRALMKLRDDMLESNPGLNVFSPCTGDGPCRMLRDGAERDWCHAEVAWRPPSLVAQLDELSGLEKSSLKFAYFILRRDGSRLHDAVCESPGDVWRVVGDVLKEKGKEKIALCGAERFGMLVRLKRDRSCANQAVGRVRRGCLLELHGADVRPSELRAVAETLAVLNGPFLLE